MQGVQELDFKDQGINWREQNVLYVNTHERRSCDEHKPITPSFPPPNTGNGLPPQFVDQGMKWHPPWREEEENSLQDVPPTGVPHQKYSSTTQGTKTHSILI